MWCRGQWVNGWCVQGATGKTRGGGRRGALCIGKRGNALLLSCCCILAEPGAPSLGTQCHSDMPLTTPPPTIEGGVAQTKVWASSGRGIGSSLAAPVLLHGGHRARCDSRDIPTSAAPRFFKGNTNWVDNDRRFTCRLAAAKPHASADRGGNMLMTITTSTSKEYKLTRTMAKVSVTLVPKKNRASAQHNCTNCCKRAIPYISESLSDCLLPFVALH